ncbi:MAG: hypothetical protein P8189_15780 [Anaerolineae bacterium]
MSINEFVNPIAVILLAAGSLLAGCCASPPAPAATATATTPPATEDAGNPAAEIAHLILAEQLSLEPSAVAIKGVEAVQWPDSCLGIQARDVMCAMHVVPGYRVTLEAQGVQYEIHTNEDGSDMAPLPMLSIRWQAGDLCQTADMNYNVGVAAGSCDGELTTVPFASDTQPLDMARFATTYHSFRADTPAGSLDFFGLGDQIASLVEQRIIAEWARGAGEQALGQTGAGLALTWHREGGIAGFCDGLTIHTDGEADATSCKSGQNQHLGYTFLDDAQQEQLYTWMDTLQSLEVTQTDEATADAMTVRLAFEGRGSTEPTDADTQAIEAFASQLYLEIAGQATSEVQRVDILTTGLSVEVPDGWQRLEPNWVWTPDPAGGLRLGVTWVDLTPPQEPEAALLPQNAQIVQSEPVELSWGSGRTFTVEVYGPAAEGSATQAPVQSVETHVIVVAQIGDTRRAFDLFASAPTAAELDTLAPALQDMLDSSALNS